VDLGEAVKALLAFELQQFAEHLDHPRMVALRKLLEHHLRALSVYEPGPYGGEFVLLQATEVSNPAIQEQDNGWRPLASAGLQVHRIPGNHHSILWPPNVDILAQQLRACLRQLPQARSTVSGDRQAS
jgi:thioesterase domain-containing protein